MKVSIITVCWNSERYITDAISSVLNQSYDNIEYILIDGKSSDNTIDIIKSFESKFNGRMKWISESDNGLYDAMNKGINMATGDIIGILNSDDFFTDNKVISKVVEGFNDQDVDAIYGDVVFVEPSDLDKTIRYYSSKIFSRTLMRLGFIPAHPTFYAKKECFDKYGLYSLDYKIGADFELLLRFIYVNKIRISYIPKCFVTMRLGGISTSGLKSHTQIMNDHLKAFRANNIYTNRVLLSLRYIYKLKEFIFKS